MKIEKVISNNVYLFPFESVPSNSDIIIYGYGDCGKQYRRQIEKTGFAQIKYIVDAKFESVKDDIKEDSFISPKELSTVYGNEIIIIAVDNKDSAEKIKKIIEDSIRVDVDVVWKIHRLLANDLENSGGYNTSRTYMSKDEFIDLFSAEKYDHIMSLKQMLSCVATENLNMVRIGNKHDGGYVMCEPSMMGGNVAYSFGIANDVSWDMDMAKRGYEVYMYDHTIDGLPENHKKFHFFKKGLSEKGVDYENLFTLQTLINNNHHLNQENMVLKVDIEGSEYGFLRNEQYDLRCFSQIVIELHNILDFNIAIKEAIARLVETHISVHLHANNYGKVYYIDGIPFPDTLEATFVRRDIVRPCKSDTYTLPLGVDSPNWEGVGDINLSDWIKNYNI